MSVQLIQITAGKGPAECCYAVSRLAPILMREAEKQQLNVEILDTTDGRDNKGYKSMLLSVEGDQVEPFIAQWEGTIQWIAESPFRKGHKRKNWFVGLFSIDQPDDEIINDKDYKIEVMRASGPGGQHVNKTESAVRITHIPLGISAIAQDQRSQIRNRSLAFARLQIKLEERAEQSKTQAQQDQWQRHNELERGNPVRVYVGRDFRVK